jgi:hypothetical protein
MSYEQMFRKAIRHALPYEKRSPLFTNDVTKYRRHPDDAPIPFDHADYRPCEIRIPHVRDYGKLIVEACTFAAGGNVGKKVQKEVEAYAGEVVDHEGQHAFVATFFHEQRISRLIRPILYGIRFIIVAGRPAVMPFCDIRQATMPKLAYALELMRPKDPSDSDKDGALQQLGYKTTRVLRDKARERDWPEPLGKN